MTKYPPATDATPEQLARALLRRRPVKDEAAQEEVDEDVAASLGRPPEDEDS